MPNLSIVAQPTAAPTRKVTYTAVAGALFTALAWAVEEFSGVVVPSEVQGAIHTAIALLVGYMVHDRMNT